MDEACSNCPGLVDSRERVVHGYGDVGAELLFVGSWPGPAAERTGIPLLDAGDGQIRTLLVEFGYLATDVDPPEPMAVYLTAITRCRHPDRPPSQEEIGNCEPFLNAEIRTINPEILLPVGELAFDEVIGEYTTRSIDDVGSLASVHGEAIRGRGFEIIPVMAPAAMDEAALSTLRETFEGLQERDYRQTKGRRRR